LPCGRRIREKSLPQLELLFLRTTQRSIIQPAGDVTQERRHHLALCASGDQDLLDRGKAQIGILEKGLIDVEVARGIQLGEKSRSTRGGRWDLERGIRVE
jgi:hypothetical protein